MNDREARWLIQVAKQYVIGCAFAPSKRLNGSSVKEMARRQLPLKLSLE
jgi:hypothetical protein